ncbi:MAG: flagellar biogenesis protein FliO [Planctomycetota bacterium]|jgi:flagellar biogenesis protein FliO
MKSAPKWLLIPPAVAVLLILGPMSMGESGDETGSAKTSQPAFGQPTAAQTASARPAARQPEPNGSMLKPRAVAGSLVPRTPDMWKMASALIGVLLLGAGGIMVIKRMRGGATPQGKTALATLRQTVRLTTKQALHAIEFDNRILLIGETDKGLTLIDRGSLPEAVNDEATVLARQHQEQEDDDGAVPHNLLIPRPGAAPRAPAAPVPAANAAIPSKADVAIAKLNSFRTLLAKAGH